MYTTSGKKVSKFKIKFNKNNFTPNFAPVRAPVVVQGSAGVLATPALFNIVKLGLEV